MTISQVGSASANATSVTLPTHQKGDLILLCAYRNSAAAIPTVPAGWVAARGIAAVTNALVIATRQAVNSSETSGTWTNATQIAAVVYRASSGLLVAGGIGATSGTSGSGVAVTYTGITASTNVTNRWVVAAIGHRSIDTDVEVAPALLTNVLSVVGGAAGELAVHDSNGNLASWATTNYTLTAGTSSGWVSIAIEIAETDYPITGGGATIHRIP